MGLFDFFKPVDIDRELSAYHQTPGALLLDVRTPGEYASGHIPGSKNIPLQTLDKVEQAADNKHTPLFVYCQSGSRSRQAADLLGHMGYTNVTNMGGMSAYSGKVEV